MLCLTSIIINSMCLILLHFILLLTDQQHTQNIDANEIKIVVKNEILIMRFYSHSIIQQKYAIIV